MIVSHFFHTFLWFVYLVEIIIIISVEFTSLDIIAKLLSVKATSLRQNWFAWNTSFSYLHIHSRNVDFQMVP